MNTEMCNIFIGVDPGVNGALAAIKIVGDVTQHYEKVDCVDMPVEMTKSKKKQVSPHGLNLWIEHVIEMCAPCNVMCTVEHVHSLPGNGGASMFSFGRIKLTNCRIILKFRMSFRMATSISGYLTFTATSSPDLRRARWT